MASPSTDHTPEPDLSNHQLGDYLIGRRLGRGGMADVYLAEQQSLRRQVALKVLRSNLARDDSFVRRFHNEAQAAASLVHANIVQIYEVGCVDGVHFIAQEYVDGQNLKQMILRRSRLDVRKAVKIIRQVAAALHKAGQRGIVHRDIKPENILITSAGEVKVADFGLARVTSEGKRVDLTQVGMTLGTPLYMSPEQVEGHSLDPRSDLYSFGVMCYEILSGRPPFEGDNAFSVAVQHLKTEPQRLETVREDLPGGLGRIVHKLLAKKPDERFQSAADVLRELRLIAIEGLEEWPASEEDWNSVEWETMASSRVAATQKLATVMLRETRLASRWRWLIALLLGAVVAFGGGAGAAWLLRPKSLLEVSAGEVDHTPRQPTVEAQFDYARETGKERDFEAVEQYFPGDDNPKNEEFIRKAQLELVRIYVDYNRLDEAFRLSGELAVQDADAWAKIQAMVLQANILARQPGKLAEGIGKLPGLINAMEAADRTSVFDRGRVLSALEKARLREVFEEIWKDRFPSPKGEPRRG